MSVSRLARSTRATHLDARSSHSSTEDDRELSGGWALLLEGLPLLPKSCLLSSGKPWTERVERRTPPHQRIAGAPDEALLLAAGVVADMALPLWTLPSWVATSPATWHRMT